MSQALWNFAMNALPYVFVCFVIVLFFSWLRGRY